VGGLGAKIAVELAVEDFGGSLLDHFQPDCAGRKWSISLFDRMIHAPGTFPLSAIML
jgi:hypothetical protein